MRTSILTNINIIITKSILTWRFIASEEHVIKSEIEILQMSNSQTYKHRAKIFVEFNTYLLIIITWYLQDIFLVWQKEPRFTYTAHYISSNL